MALTDQERALVAQRSFEDAISAPLRRIMGEWGVETTHKFEQRIREVKLVSSGTLESDWNFKLVAGDTGVIVGEFSFAGYGRLFDMRRVGYTRQIPVEEIKEWVEHKVEQGRIKYSTLAERRGLSFADPKVIHDIAWRIARSNQFNISRKRWYNKGKEASLSVLYDQLSEAFAEVVLLAQKATFQNANAPATAS